MQIINQSIHTIDYERNRVYRRETPPAFEEYVEELISHINTNTSIRDYKTQSPNTEVISCVLQILQKRADTELVMEMADFIANRLLVKEVDAQRRVARMDINVQKGSLIQVLIFDEVEQVYSYLLAKVEHSNFVDDTDFSFKTGFSKDKKTIWKSCLFDLTEVGINEYPAKIYSNTVAHYWCSDFLELVEMISDELNTTTAFKAIDSTLNRNIKNLAPRDHTIIRNTVISYFKSHEHFDYGEMLTSVLGEYIPFELSPDKIVSLREKLDRLPEDKRFDRQFNSVSSAINARIKKVYVINNGIQLKVSSEAIDDLEDTISAYREADGTRYIKIKTNNELTFRRFCNPQ